MPTPTRNALNAVTFLLGVNTAGDQPRARRINGLPESFLNITLDGVSNNDNFNKSTDGFFAPVTPRQDAIEAVTVTTAVGGADVGGHGAVTINFVTRSGTNPFTGSAYEYYRDPALNTNYWFNKRNGLPKNDVRLNQFGIRHGGPIVIPGCTTGAARRSSSSTTRSCGCRTTSRAPARCCIPRAHEGWFRYTGAAREVREVNVLDAGARRTASSRPPIRRCMRTLGNIHGGDADDRRR